MQQVISVPRQSIKNCSLINQADHARLYYTSEGACDAFGNLLSSARAILCSTFCFFSSSFAAMATSLCTPHTHTTAYWYSCWTQAILLILQICHSNNLLRSLPSLDCTTDQAMQALLLRQAMVLFWLEATIIAKFV
jgi:hypothetical protein